MAKRISLREFQESVVAKLQGLSGKEHGQNPSKLGILAGTERWLVDLEEISEVVPLPELAAVPLTHPWFAGVANIRGNLYSIVDLSAFTCGVPAQPGPERRLLLANPKFMVNTGLIVSRLLGLRNPEQMQPGTGNNTLPPWVAAEYADPEGQTWKVLDMRALVSTPAFLQIGI
ncbi:MAG: chemotaxis protein CheW [Pseudomonadota bacterium]|jgi:twitching motility protein PilI